MFDGGPNLSAAELNPTFGRSEAAAESSAGLSGDASALNSSSASCSATGFITWMSGACFMCPEHWAASESLDANKNHAIADFARRWGNRRFGGGYGRNGA